MKSSLVACLIEVVLLCSQLWVLAGESSYQHKHDDNVLNEMPSSTVQENNVENILMTPDLSRKKEDLDYMEKYLKKFWQKPILTTSKPTSPVYHDSKSRLYPVKRTDDENPELIYNKDHGQRNPEKSDQVQESSLRQPMKDNSMKTDAENFPREKKNSAREITSNGMHVTEAPPIEGFTRESWPITTNSEWQQTTLPRNAPYETVTIMADFAEQLSSENLVLVDSLERLKRQADGDIEGCGSGGGLPYICR